MDGSQIGFRIGFGMTKPAELYACLYVREFPVQALLRLRTDLQDKPCAVMDGKPPLEQVCSFTGKARVLGLARGMTRVEVDTIPAVTALLRSRKEEAAAKAVLLECAGAFSPRIEGQSKDGEFLCVIDIAGTRRLFGPPESLAENLLTRVRSLGVTASIAISRNFHAAVCLAKALPPLTVKVIPTGEESAAFAPLSLAVLDLTEERAGTFSLWGIRTLAMLAALPEKELTARMGQSGKHLRQLARGETQHFFQPVEPAFTLEEHMELDSPVELLDSLLFVFGVMLDQFILRATSRVLSLASVSITLYLDGGTTHTRTVRPAVPTNDKKLWIKLLHLDLEAHPPQAMILALSLAAEAGSANKVQFGLFSSQLPEPSRLDVTLARIRAIVGDENVGRAVLRDTHEPGGFSMEPFTVPSGSPSVIPSCPSRSAMRKVRPAEIVRVTLQGRRPKAFVFREKHYAVERTYGPWLINGDWWQPTLWGQEQWDLVARAQDNSLLCCCLVGNQIQNCWQMAALYD
jgi:protein ImuB